MFTVVYDCETDETEITLNHEHEEYKWVSPAEARNQMPIEPLKTAVERAITRHEA
ncbi:hypothetical protein C472_13647 [Halorubrum tebenquichense DSM 14210]|uniref:NUDIX hydrolase n=2 Tax=Halorubrum tebenquichense TaxID=119434 RepID=M0DED1_9EURY|nr:hypothetical protein C472_13647 [Halorubrum tebenquichense DSM 14210]